jgi:penicillin-binding protein 1C
VLVVWVGEFDGSGNPAFIGIDAAAPLFLRMVDALRAQRLDPGELPQPQPANLRRVEVCTSTGAPPDALCPARTTTWFIAGKSPIQPSHLHRALWVDAQTGQVLCGPQAASAPHAKEVVVEQWGSDMQRLFKQAGLPRRTLDDSACRSGASSAGSTLGPVPDATGADAPTITSPCAPCATCSTPASPSPCCCAPTPRPASKPCTGLPTTACWAAPPPAKACPGCPPTRRLQPAGGG